MIDLSVPVKLEARRFRPQATHMGIRVLVIEDEPGIADFVVRGLREEGFTVEIGRASCRERVSYHV